MKALPNPFIPPVVYSPEPSRFVLNEERFMADLAEMPAFLVKPSQEYLKAVELMPVLAALAGH